MQSSTCTPMWSWWVECDCHKLAVEIFVMMICVYVAAFLSVWYLRHAQILLWCAADACMRMCYQKRNMILVQHVLCYETPDWPGNSQIHEAALTSSVNYLSIRGTVIGLAADTERGPNKPPGRFDLKGTLRRGQCYRNGTFLHCSFRKLFY